LARARIVLQLPRLGPLAQFRLEAGIARRCDIGSAESVGELEPAGNARL